MKICAMITSVNYSKKLEYVLEKVRHTFDHCLVATNYKDEDTIKVAKKNNCELVFIEFGNKFNKGLAIYTMQKMAYQRFGAEWSHLLLDADTMPPDDWRPKEIAEDTLYGCSRILFECLKDFENDEFGIESSALVDSISQVGSKEIIGFFQLYKASKEYLYNIYQPTAGLSDVVFSGLFKNKIILPICCKGLGTRSTWDGIVYNDFDFNI